MLEEITFGPYITEVFLLLRDSLFLSALLHDSEAWYNVTQQDLKTLEDCDALILRQYFSLHSKCPRELPHLEIGAVPVRFIIMQRRILYLNYLMNQEPNSLLYKFLQSQRKNAVKGDWCLIVQKDLEDLDIDLSFEEIGNTPKVQLKKLLSDVIHDKSFEYLMKIKESHSKMRNLKYEKLELQNYLRPEAKLTRSEINFTIASRGNMLNLKQNFKSENKNNLECRICLKESSVESQLHIYQECELLNVNAIISNDSNQYEDLFSNNADKTVSTSRRLSQSYKTFVELLNSSASDRPSAVGSRSVLD